MPHTTPGSPGAHPSCAGLLAAPAACLPVPPAHDRTAWSAAHLDRPTLDALRERATHDLTTPWPLPLASGFARYARDGNRDGYESAVFTRQHRLSRAAVMAAVTLDARWLDEVADGVTLLCEQSTWCWPAHDDTFGRGAVVPDVHRPFLDLGAGEVAAQLAWIDHLLACPLDERYPGLRARIRHEADVRVLTPFTARRDWHWLGLSGDVHNWSAWIHGNVLVAALVLMPDGEPRTHAVDLAVAGLEHYLASIPADGAIDEGSLYWWQGACRALEALDVLHHATAGALGGDLGGAVRETIAFPHRMHLGGDWYVNVADGPARVSPEQPWDALHRAARRAGDTAAEA
ncbi:heparinase, partial [Kitasatospora sp. NPDC004240]